MTEIIEKEEVPTLKDGVEQSPNRASNVSYSEVQHYTKICLDCGNFSVITEGRCTTCLACGLSKCEI